MELKDSVMDTLKKVNSTAKNFVRDAERTYDYYMGRGNTKYDYREKASDSDLRKTALKNYVKDLSGDYKALKDSRHNMVQIKFDARKSPKNLANRINPDHVKSNSGSLYGFITDYSDHIVTMELPMDGGASAKANQQKVMDKRNKEKAKKTNESVNPEEDSPLEAALLSFESGYDFDRSDFNSDEDYEEYIEYMNYGPEGFYEEFRDQLDFSDDFIAEYGDHEFDTYEGLELDTGHALEETPGLTMSSPKVKYRDAYDYEGYLEIEINGKKYTYVCKQGTDKRADEVASTVQKMQKHSDGKALAYLKKNMRLINNESLKKESVVFNKKDLGRLEKELKDELHKVMTSPNFGFYDDEADEYSGIQITEEDGVTKIVAHAEVGYDSLWEIMESLNKVLKKYDSDAYFDMESPGRLVAYVGTPSLNESSKGSLSKLVKSGYTVKEIGQFFKNDTGLDMTPENSEKFNSWVNDFIKSISSKTTKSESKNSFKDHHICQGCGNPLSKCTCEIKEEDLVEELSLNESEEYELLVECPCCGSGEVIFTGSLAYADHDEYISQKCECGKCGSEFIANFREVTDYEIIKDSNISVNESKSIKEGISESEIASVLRDARDTATDFGITDEFTNEYYIGSSVSAFGYPLDKLFMFLPDHLSEEDKEYQDAIRGWKENEQACGNIPINEGTFSRITNRVRRVVPYDNGITEPKSIKEGNESLKESLEESQASSHKYTDVDTVDGKSVVETFLASEHTRYRGTFAGYVCFELEDGSAKYYPVDLHGYLIDNENVWNFIKKQGLPELGFKSEESVNEATQVSNIGQPESLKESID